MSLSAGLSNTITHQTQQWVADSQLDIHARLAGVPYNLPNLDSLLEDYPPTSPRSERAPHSSAFSTSSSMAPTLIHHSHDSVTYVPSLCGASCVTSTTPTETSVSTTLAPHLDSLPLLEDNNGVLEVPAQYRPQAPVFECAFWFLSCGYIFASQEEWLIHVESHFRGEEPPRSVQCPLCEWCFTYPTDGWVAWNARMQHIAAGHTMLGQTLRTSRPDFDLFQYLWRKRLIDDADLKELVGGNHNLDRRLGNYIEAGRGAERSMRRRERGERRMGGGQHVGGGRMMQRV